MSFIAHLVPTIFPVRVFKLPPLHLKFCVIILPKSSILSSCFPSFCEARRIRLLHFSCNLAAVTIVLAISPFLLLTFHVLSTLRVLVTKSVRISYETESINFLCLVMMGTDDVCHQQKINDRRTVDACGSLFFPPFLFFFFLLLRVIIITLHSMHVATIRVDIWWMVLVTATKKHISALQVSLNFSRSANLEKTAFEINNAVLKVMS